MSRFAWLARRLIWRELRIRPLRQGLSALAVALGVALFVSTETNTAAILSAVHGARGALESGVDLLVTRDAAGIDDDALDALRERPEFASVAGVVEIAATTTSGTPLTLLGVDPRDAMRFAGAADGMRLVDVDPAAAFLRQDGIVASSRLLAALGLRVGGDLEIDTSIGTRTFRIVGAVEAPGALAEALMGFAFIPLDAAAAITGRPGRFDRVRLSLAEGVDPKSARTAIAAVLGVDSSVKSPDEWTRDATIGLDTFRAVFFLNDLLALLIAGFFVFNSVSAVLAERTREAGLLRASGMSRRGLAATFVGEAIALGAVGCVVGVVLGSVLAVFTGGLLADVVSRVQFVVPPVSARLPSLVTIAQAFVLAASTTVAASALAMVPLVRRAPLELLQVAESGERRAAAIRRAAHIAVVVAVLVGIGLFAAPRGHERVAGTIAVVVLAFCALCGTPAVVLALGAFVRRRSFARRPALAFALDALTLQPMRTTMTIGAFALALALVVAHGGVTRGMGDGIRSWLDGNIPSDVIVGGIAFPFREEGAGSVAAIDGVERAFRYRYRKTRALGDEIALAAMDFDVARERSRFQFHAGEPEAAFDAVIGGRGAFVSENFAWKHGLVVGDRFALATPDGPGEFEIVAIVRDYTHPGGTVLLHLPVYRERFHDPLVDFVELCLAPGVDAERVAEAARAARARDHAFLPVATTQRYLDHVVGFVDDLRALSVVQLVLALAIGAVSIFATVTLSVASRRRELALLRAVGMRPRDWRASVAWEVYVIAGAAAVGGLALGHVLWIPANLVFRAFSGFVFDHAWPWRESVLALLGAMVTAWIAARLPLSLLERHGAYEAMDE
ncbi:MAG: FtsX-like permease family protein [Planctomycetes bacterium]|nr:FtsX-like permease family protein [Planctomycetota bacterium]